MILVFVEHEAGELKGQSRDALAFARGIGASLGARLHVVAIGDGAAAAAPALSGVDVLYALRIEGTYAPAAWAEALAQLLEEASPQMVVAAATDRGSELLAHLGANRELPMISNCIEVTPGDPTLITRERWGGTVLEEVRTSAPQLLLTVSASADVAEDDSSLGAGAPALEELVIVPAPEDLRACLVRVEPLGGSGISLPEARIVVGGGRGVGSSQGFGILDELADRLGGAVGVSRAVTSAGWRPHAEQIGQTGVRIAPDLYIACGISGASQHMVGCAGAKRILVINADPDASIMARADEAVVGDLLTVVPAIIEEIKRRLSA